MYIYTIYTCIKTIYICWLPDNLMAWRAKLFVRVIIKLEPAALGWTAVISPDLPIPWPSLQAYHITQVVLASASMHILKHLSVSNTLTKNNKQCRKYYMEIDTISIKQDIYMYVGLFLLRYYQITNFKNRLLIDQFEYSTPFSNWSMLDNTFWNLLQIL